MRLPTLLIFFFQAVLDVKTVLTKSHEDVSGYLGETVTLPSGANPSWRLTKFEWSIFINNTWIATYNNGRPITDHVFQYKGRLTLNTTSGDLTIRNLTAGDAREYNVDLHSSEGEDAVHKIKLIVKQKLQQPSVHVVTSTSIENGCLMVMTCSSPDNGVELSWSVEPLGVLTISKRNPGDGSQQLFAFVNTPQNLAKFTCTSSRNTERASSNPVAPKCDVLNCPTQPPPTTETQSRTRFSLFFFTGVVVGGLISALIYCFREKIKSACQHQKEQTCSSV